MGEFRPFKTRDRAKRTYLTADECAQHAADLFARAYEMTPGTARQSTLREACDYRMLAEMKRVMAVPKASSPMG